MDMSICHVLQGTTTKPKLMIIGGGGLGQVAQQVAQEQNQYEVLGFCDDAYEGVDIHQRKLHVAPRYLSELVTQPDIYFIIAIGDPAIRQSFITRYELPLSKFANVIHPLAFIADNAILGQGILAMPYAIVNSGAQLGNHLVLNSASIVEHKSQVGDYTSISPKAVICGGVTIGAECFIGAGATIVQCLHLGQHVLVGANSLVLHDLPDNVVAYGSPIRVIKPRLNAVGQS